ncbi:hypothetical protein P9239_21375 [Caballeronia sp. LZ062]|uniref:hypothetical protein n=1 Tax=unclassified Caballeronia TaxID=2646786 RepID=UPI0028639E68|nr:MULTISPECIES: hypothetical protein [unclassified Caballeronia]MDR5856230.1 hypothetical protein [Caballeronia sp. LZ050]MDR5872901.1 hypothetical protein [Caballeronia sp. LZ062]
MCGMCGLLGGGRHWSNTVAAGEGVNARRQRYVQIAHANRLLQSYRLRLADFHGQSFVLASPTGAQVIVDDFMQVWKAAETMLGRPLDPLTLFSEDEVLP